MKYPDFLDICIALTGRAPFAGAHIDHNRKATLRVNVTNVKDIDDSFYPLLGYHVGKLAANRIPAVVGLEHAAPSEDDLKAFGAAFATVSSAPMFHIVGVTPEATALAAVTSIERDVPTVDVAAHELESTWEELNSAKDERVDLVSLGNPHFSLGELRKLASLCRNRKKHSNTAVIVACGRATYDKANEVGLISDLEQFGVQFVTDTCWCMIMDPIIPPVTKTIMTNSGKFAHYGPGVTGRKFYFGSLAECVNAACNGTHATVRPCWMSQD
jgi:predicted aconitase